MKHKVLLNALGLNRHFLLVIFPYSDHVTIPIRVFSFKVGHFLAHTQLYNIYELDKASNLLGIVTLSVLRKQNQQLKKVCWGQIQWVITHEFLLFLYSHRRTDFNMWKQEYLRSINSRHAKPDYDLFKK